MPLPKEVLTSQTSFDHLWHMVGNTPMVDITYRYNGRERHLFVKCEHYNLTGSIKDRMALYILQQAYCHGRIRPGDTIVEATSGNTGIAFCALGKALGHKVRIIMPDWLSEERVNIIKSLGAEVMLVSREEGGFLGSIRISEDMAAADPTIFLPKQFENRYNAEAHAKTTAKEISRQLHGVGRTPDALVAGVGTGGTVMGMHQYFKSLDPSVRIHPLEPMESPTLSTGYKNGRHRIQGISDEFIPSILHLQDLDPILQASDGDSILMAQKLSTQLGLAVGISSGANVLGAIQVQEQMGGEATVVTMLCDSNKKYLSTDLMKEEPVKGNYLTPHVELLSYKAINRISV